MKQGTLFYDKELGRYNFIVNDKINFTKSYKETLIVHLV